MKITKLGMLIAAQELMQVRGLRNHPAYQLLKTKIDVSEKALDNVELSADRGEIIIVLRNENASPTLCYKWRVLDNNGRQPFVGIEEILIARAPDEEISLRVTSEDELV